MPAGQLVHELELTAAEYVPCSQLRHTAELLAPSTELYSPAAQLRHTFELFAALTTANVPAGQLVHELEACSSE